MWQILKTMFCFQWIDAICFSYQIILLWMPISGCSNQHKVYNFKFFSRWVSAPVTISSQQFQSRDLEVNWPTELKRTGILTISVVLFFLAWRNNGVAAGFLMSTLYLWTYQNNNRTTKQAQQKWLPDYLHSFCCSPGRIFFSRDGRSVWLSLR